MHPGQSLRLGFFRSTPILAFQGARRFRAGKGISRIKLATRAVSRVKEWKSSCVDVLLFVYAWLAFPPIYRELLVRYQNHMSLKYTGYVSPAFSGFPSEDFSAARMVIPSKAAMKRCRRRAKIHAIARRPALHRLSKDYCRNFRTASSPIRPRLVTSSFALRPSSWTETRRTWPS